MHSVRNFTLVSALTLFAAAAALAAPPRPRQATHAFAQSLVNQLHAAHPEYAEIGINAVLPGKGCYGIASTDKTDINQKCESDDIVPMRTHRMAVGTEGKNLDISLPLHDASGAMVGVIGIETPAVANRAATLRQVQAAVQAIEKQIPSKAKLIS